MIRTIFKKIKINQFLTSTNKSIALALNKKLFYTNLNSPLTFFISSLSNSFFLSRLILNRWMLFSSFNFYLNINNFQQSFSNSLIWKYSNNLNNINHNTSIYLHHHGSFLTSLSTIILPISLFTEKSSKYSNLEGCIYQTRRINRKFTSVKYDWTFWYDLLIINNLIFYTNSNNLNNFFIFLSFLNYKNYLLHLSGCSLSYLFKSLSFCLIFEHPYINFTNFIQSRSFHFIFFFDFLIFTFICIGNYFKYSYYISNLIHLNSNNLFQAYKKHIYTQYSTLLYSHKYLNFY